MRTSMRLEDYLKLPYSITLRPDEDGDWVAEIEDLEGCVAHGKTPDEAFRRLDEAKALWIEMALKKRQPIPQPSTVESMPSGRWLQRVPRSLHKNLSRLAKVEGTSLNQLVTSILSEYAGATRRNSKTTAHMVVVGSTTWTDVPGFTWGSWVPIPSHQPRWPNIYVEEDVRNIGRGKG